MSDSLDTSLTDDFNPLSPHGERPMAMTRVDTNQLFQSTLPAWGETTFPGLSLLRPVGFQSTLPAWGETREIKTSIALDGISIHSPRMGRDLYSSAV